jgi:16S rRNA (uracil1498-N3)-methyltransferase
MRRRFFVDRFQDTSAVLGGKAANHLGRVLRAEPGQLYELSDGQTAWLARTERIDRDAIHFELVERLPAIPETVRIMLLLAIVKFDRFEWAIEKATELGVDEIVPLIAARSEKGLVVAAAKRADRWSRILTESAQQARRLRVPRLGEAAKPMDAFRETSCGVKLLLSERGGALPMRQALEPAVAAGGRESTSGVALAVGPEGGWTEAEFSGAAAAGFSEAALGANILRTETAVCAALAAVQYAFEAFRTIVDAPDSQGRAYKEEL